MRYTFTLLAILVSLSTSSKVPLSYYPPELERLSGEELWDLLYQVIQTKTTLTYDNLWSAYSNTDNLIINTDTLVRDIYSDLSYSNSTYNYRHIYNRCSVTPTREGVCYNREHTIPASWFNDQRSSMYTDLFNVRPADGYINTLRNNHPYGEVDSTQILYHFQNGAKIGLPAAYLETNSLKVYEPADEFKGDLARSYFYMATRYKSIVSTWSGGMFGSTNGFEPWALKMLMRWHKNDPVSSIEKERTDAIHKIQGNRNPFIDYPQWVDCIWDNNLECTSLGTIPILSLTFIETGKKVDLTYNIISDSPELHFNGLSDLICVVGQTDKFEQGQLSINSTNNTLIITPYYINPYSNKIYLKLRGKSNGIPFQKIDSLEIESIYTSIPKDEKYNFQIYPNPTSSDLYINFEEVKTGSIKIHLRSINGQTINTYSFSNPPMQISIPISVKDGIYIISIESNKSSISKKILIQK